VLGLAELRRYVVGWPRPGDHGVVAGSERQAIGAARWRTFGGDDPGYGFVASDVPELAMAVTDRRRGVGSDAPCLSGWSTTPATGASPP
jgi:hypothetical protein